MKKEFVDYLYELRGLIQADIDRLVDISKQPREANHPEQGAAIDAELRTRRSQIQSINQTIEKYFEIHTKPK